MLTDQAVSLLRKAQLAILREPTRLDMDNWVQNGYIDSRDDEPIYASCDTTGCIAGHVIAFAYGTTSDRHARNGLSMEAGAMHALGLRPNQAQILFYAGDWPIDLYNLYVDAKDQSNKAEMARITSQRIERFIQSGGEE